MQRTSRNNIMRKTWKNGTVCTSRRGFARSGAQCRVCVRHMFEKLALGSNILHLFEKDDRKQVRRAFDKCLDKVMVKGKIILVASGKIPVYVLYDVELSWLGGSFGVRFFLEGDRLRNEVREDWAHMCSRGQREGCRGHGQRTTVCHGRSRGHAKDQGIPPATQNGHTHHSSHRGRRRLNQGRVQRRVLSRT